MDAVVAADPRDTPEVYRLAEHEALLDAISRLRAAEMHRLQVIDAADTATTEAGRATRSWLIEEMRCNAGDASRRMRVARSLPAHPLVQKAFEAGEIRFEHAETILGALASVPDDFREIVETALVDMSRTCSPSGLGAAIEQLLHACGVESSHDEAHVRRLNKRGLRIASTYDGMRAITGMLTPEVAEAFELAIDALARPAGDDDERSREQRQHDAVGELANHYLAHADVPATRGERPRIVVTIDLETLERELEGKWGRLDSGVTIAPTTARRLACDAEILPAVLGARGDVLDIGIAARTFNTAVRRAAWLEQQGQCAFPGCRRPPADCHHIVWWSRGGPSTLDNAAWLCAYHHWLVHEGRWSMQRDPDRSLVFTGPRGQMRRRHPGMRA